MNALFINRARHLAAMQRRAHTLTIYAQRDLPLCGEASSDDGFEYEVEVEFDEGSVYSALIVSSDAGAVKPPVVIELTANERESAEVDWSDELIAREEAAREDDADRRADQ